VPFYKSHQQKNWVYFNTFWGLKRPLLALSRETFDLVVYFAVWVWALDS